MKQQNYLPTDRNAVSLEQEDKIKKLVADGYSRAEIVKISGVSLNQYRYIASKYNLYVHRRDNSIKIVDPILRLAECSDCGKIKSLDLFRVRKRGTNKPYQVTYCYDCQYKKVGERFNSDIKSYITNRWTTLKSRSNKKDIVFSIPKDEFMDQFLSQNGKCFYTDEVLVCSVLNGFGERNQLSTDKIIPELGYVSGNVVFCTKQINICKGDLTLEQIEKWMPKWFERIVKFRNQK
jgi:hypothetical protein